MVGKEINLGSGCALDVLRTHVYKNMLCLCVYFVLLQQIYIYIYEHFKKK